MGIPSFRTARIIPIQKWRKKWYFVFSVLKSNLENNLFVKGSIISIQHIFINAHSVTLLWENNKHWLTDKNESQTHCASHTAILQVFMFNWILKNIYHVYHTTVYTGAGHTLHQV